MGIVFRLAELLLMLVPVAGVVFAGVSIWKRVQQSSDRRDGPRLDDAPSEVASTARPTNPSAMWRMITRTIDEHARTDTRWMEYELDVDKLLDFPLMTDMRDPLTTEFHKAKLRADLLRPGKAEDLFDDRESAARYLARGRGLHDRVRRRRDRGHPQAPQRLLPRGAAADRPRPQPAQRGLRHRRDANEREQAYALASKELDGLVVLPPATRAGIERGIAGQLDG